MASTAAVYDEKIVILPLLAAAGLPGPAAGAMGGAQEASATLVLVRARLACWLEPLWLLLADLVFRLT